MLNLTQHVATKEQIEAGVVEPKNKQEVIDLITFNGIPSQEGVKRRAERLSEICKEKGHKKVMIGGAPYFMSELELQIAKFGIKAYYAFSKRECTEKQMPDGSVEKKMIFRHAGFVESRLNSYFAVK